jgi:hypothetical protein
VDDSRATVDPPARHLVSANPNRPPFAHRDPQLAADHPESIRHRRMGGVCLRGPPVTRAAPRDDEQHHDGFSAVG